MLLDRYSFLKDNNNIESDNNTFDLCHKNIDQYMSSSKYTVNKYKKNLFDNDFYFDELRNVDTLFKQMISSDIEINGLDEFKSIMQKIKISSYYDENNYNNGFLIDHLFTSVKHIKNDYILIDKKWYELQEGFISELNELCSEYLEDSHSIEKKIVWGYKYVLDKTGKKTKKYIDENEYNLMYLNATDTLVLDKIFSDKIEICDIMKLEKNRLCFVHVKIGFGNTMRDLCAQALVSAKKVLNEFSSLKFIDDLHKEVFSSSAKSPYRIKVKEQFEKEGFADVSKLKNRISKYKKDQIVFVIAILDKNTNEKNIKENISDYGSNIAKFSLISLYRDMKALGIELKVLQIKQGQLIK